MSENLHPLVYFWIAFYNDNTCLPQFDFETGAQNPFKSIDQEKLEKFGLFPFNESLAIKANQVQNGVARIQPNLPHFILKLAKDQRLIYVRRNFIHTFTYLKCGKCGYQWQWMVTKPVQRSEFGMMIHPDHIVQRYLGEDRKIPKCPKCGVFLPIICPDCQSYVNIYAREGTKVYYWKCSKCGKEYVKDITESEDSVRRLVYLLGWQTTKDGINQKHIMFISEEDGSFEINENFNYK